MTEHVRCGPAKTARRVAASSLAATVPTIMWCARSAVPVARRTEAAKSGTRAIAAEGTISILCVLLFRC